MSKYIKKRRSPGAEETWGHQGSVESLSGDDIDGPSDRRFVGGQDVIIIIFLLSEVDKRCVWLCVVAGGVGGWGGMGVVFVWGDPYSKVRFGVFFFREKVSGRT